MTELTFRIISKNTIEKQLPIFMDLSKDLAHDNWIAANYLMDLESKWTLSLACYENEQLAGYIIASKRNEKHVHIHKFVVDIDSRGKGIGKILLSEFINRINTFTELITLKVYNDNPRAIKFYLDNGFFLKESNDLLLTMERVL
jgi:ribosomal protein S18 acetylase RimI-like enzyme